MTENTAPQNGAQQTALAKSNYTQIKALFRSEEALERFASALGNKHQAESYISTVLIAVQNNDKLMECSPRSIMVSALRAASLRLSCDPGVRHSHLVPFNNKVKYKVYENGQEITKTRWENQCTLIIGYQGYEYMAIRTGKFRYLNAFPVWKGETVTENRMKGIHVLSGYKETADAPAIGYMLAYELRTGFAHTFYMTVDEIRAHGERYSKTFKFDDSPWKNNFDLMARKTVIRLGLTRDGLFDPLDIAAWDAADEVIDESTVIDVQAVDAPVKPSGNGKAQSPADILEELGYKDRGNDPAEQEKVHQAIADAKAADIAEDENYNRSDPPAPLFDPGPADPYADLRAKLDTDAATAFWTLADRLKWKRPQAADMLKECRNDFKTGFEALIRNTPPAN